MNLNKVFIFGNLTRDPERRSLPSGQAVVSMGVATNRFFISQGQKQTDVEYHNVVLFGKQAEIAAQYLKKGSSVLIEGRIKTRSWQDQQGQKHYKTEIIGERMQLGPRTSGSTGNYQNSGFGQGQKQNTQPEPEIPIIEEEIANSPDQSIDGLIEDDNENIDIKDIPF